MHNAARLARPFSEGVHALGQVFRSDGHESHRSDDHQFRPRYIEHWENLRTMRQDILSVGGSCLSDFSAVLSSAFRPALKLLMPLPRSPITDGSLPAPKITSTTSSTIRICQKLSPMFVSAFAAHLRLVIIGKYSLLAGLCPNQKSSSWRVPQHRENRSWRWIWRVKTTASSLTPTPCR